MARLKVGTEYKILRGMDEVRTSQQNASMESRCSWSTDRSYFSSLGHVNSGVSAALAVISFSALGIWIAPHVSEVVTLYRT